MNRTDRDASTWPVARRGNEAQMTHFKLLIDGQLVDGARRIDVINPAIAEPFARSPVADEAQLIAAIAAAKRAFPAWAAAPWEDRQTRLARFADRLERQSEALANLLVKEQGKPFAQALFEVAATISGIRYCAGLTLSTEVRDHSYGSYEMCRKPLGVVACITPWNFPMILAANKYAPALLTGNTVVLKPAPTTPLSTLEIGRLAQDIFPAGVFNVIADENDLGRLMTMHPDIAKVSFTGSTETGKHVMRSAADTLKRLTLELGGNDPAIVLKDADVAAAARGLAETAFLNAGQICAAPKRIYVANEIYDAFCDQMACEATALKLGAGDEDGVSIGPLQNQMQFEKVKSFLKDASKDGKVIAGGHVANRPGYFIEPTVVRDIDEGSRLVTEEQFGPVIPILRFEQECDAILRANEGEFGLGASVWSSNLDNAKAVGHRLVAGTVWINQHLAMGPDIPFAGAKQSGFGVEAGLEGILEFTRIQVLNTASAA